MAKKIVKENDYLKYLNDIGERVIVLDTETTGLHANGGDKIVEIGAIEYINGNKNDVFYHLINPERNIPQEVIDIHGIDNDTVENEKKFYQIADNFLDFIEDAVVIIHNSKFDVGFINAELEAAGRKNGKKYSNFETYCVEVIDSLKTANELFPGKKVNLDALSKKFGIDISKRELHGALIDSTMLAECFGAMIKYKKENDFEIEKKQYHDILPESNLKLKTRPINLGM